MIVKDDVVAFKKAEKIVTIIFFVVFTIIIVGAVWACLDGGMQ